MDEKRFDAIAQRLQDGSTRRAAFRLLSGGSLAGMAGWLGLREVADAKRKRKKRKKKQKWCPKHTPVFCTPNLLYPQGYCVPAGSTCCNVTSGGGWCPSENPQCCPPTWQDPDGLCIPANDVCCHSEEGGGYCGPGETCCPPTWEYPEGACADSVLDCPTDGYAALRSDGVRPRKSGGAPRQETRQ